MSSNQIFVIGHVNPDTDSIASAIGYAWLLREREGMNTIAARAGAVNPQTSWVLKLLGLEAPMLLTDASPRFSSVMRRLDTVGPNQPLGDAWAIASRTGGVTPVINEDGSVFGLISSGSLFQFLLRELGVAKRQRDLKISDLMQILSREVAEQQISCFQANSRIRDSLNRILREERDEFLVIDDNGKYAGLCRQRDILNPPRLKIILVDHNEAHQALGSLDEAELIEILDHHRLGNPSTHIPIRFSVDVVGSTSTLVSERVAESGLSLPPDIAGILLAGLLSDTLILSSPTTTKRDKSAADRMARWAFGAGSVLNGESIQTFGEKVLNAGAGLSSRTPEEIVTNDMKVYQVGGLEFAIAQAEVSDLLQVSEHLDNLKIALANLKDKKGLDFAMLMVTDVVRGSSRLLLAGDTPILDGLPYPPQLDGTRLAEGVVSRKKQLLPVVLGLLEE
jgi:manganese-dependent inorganic pyrophosphatase